MHAAQSKFWAEIIAGCTNPYASSRRAWNVIDRCKKTSSLSVRGCSPNRHKSIVCVRIPVMKPTDTDVLIIGAGPAGTVAAAALLQEGLRPLIVEKQFFPRFVIGESLLPHT